MKARLIREARAWNPDYDREEAALAKQERRGYDVPQLITREPGHIQDHPESWQNCVRGYMNAEPIAVPADEECREKVREWLKARPHKIRKLAAFLKTTPSGTKAKKHHEELRKAYQDELYELDAENFPLVGDNHAEFPEEDEDD